MSKKIDFFLIKKIFIIIPEISTPKTIKNTRIQGLFRSAKNQLFSTPFFANER